MSSLTRQRIDKERFGEILWAVSDEQQGLITVYHIPQNTPDSVFLTVCDSDYIPKGDPPRYLDTRVCTTFSRHWRNDNDKSSGKLHEKLRESVSQKIGFIRCF